LPHDGIKGETVGVVDVLVARQPNMDRLPEQAVEPVNAVLATATFIERTRCKIRQPKRIIQLAYHQQTTVGTDLCATKFQPNLAVEIHPNIPFRIRTFWVIHETRPSSPSKPRFMCQMPKSGQRNQRITWGMRAKLSEARLAHQRRTLFPGMLIAASASIQIRNGPTDFQST